jgi:hypothetical protein
MYAKYRNEKRLLAATVFVADLREEEEGTMMLAQSILSTQISVLLEFLGVM